MARWELHYISLTVLHSLYVQVATQLKWARESGAIPPPDPSDLKPPSQTGERDDEASAGCTSGSFVDPTGNGRRHGEREGGTAAYGLEYFVCAA